MSTLPEIGSHVRVPWGLGTAQGEIVDAYESGVGNQVVVSVPIQGSDQSLTVTFRMDDVELTEPA